MNQYSRTRLMLGDETLEKIQNARIAVFGLGAVGSYATEALARVGVGYLRLVDFDRVDVTNINRQLYALHSTVGREKADIARERVLDINADCRVDLHPAFVNADSLTDLLSQDLDVVVDAIDGLNSKVNLLVGARDMDLPVVSSMGAAGRIDPAMVRTGDIDETRVCPLARVVRRRLHRRGLFTGIRCVYSIEKPVHKGTAPAHGEADGGVDDTTAATSDNGNAGNGSDNTRSHGRERPPIGSIPWVPGIFGLTLAAEAIRIVTEIS